MADPRLVRRLDEVADRIRRIRRLKGLSAGWLLAFACGPALFLAGVASASWLWVVALVCAALWGGLLFARRRNGDLQLAAESIERRYPDLDAALLTAVTQRPDVETGRLGFLQEQVVNETLRHSRQRDWRAAVAPSSLWRWRLCHAAALAAFLIATGVALFRGSEGEANSLVGPDARQPAPAGAEYVLTVEPGDAEVERGTGLLVMARFDGRLPAGVDLVTVGPDEQTSRIPLLKSLDDPIFGGRIPSVAGDLKYHVEYDGRTSEEFTVTTFVYPELLRADAKILPPAYTELAEKTIEDVRRISVVEGSTVTLTCRLNKPVASAELVAADGTKTALGPATPAEDVMEVALQPTAAQRLKLILTDADGRKNKSPPEFVIDVIPNLPPELKVAFPARDTRVSPLEELTVQARAQDDFGVKEFGLVFEKPDGSAEQLVLGDSAPRAKPVDFSHLISLESLNAEPNQLLSYYFYADDVGPGGESRRTFSDMFFAEVRHFEEIFRQMPSQQGQDQQQQQQQQQGQGQQQSGGQSQELLDLQKEIVSATWNIMRRFPTAPAEAQRETFFEDVEAVAEAQSEAINRTQQMAEGQQDVLLRQFADEAVDHMQKALVTLQKAADEFSQTPLPEARSGAQAAYQSLLRLQAREFLVRNQQQNSQQSQSQQASQQRQQRQLDQLELRNDRNRYEQQRQAQQAQQQQQQNREEMQALNRLRELAKRQEDLNERIRELENRLRDARTEQEREEVRRQLKRLQEEQQEMLRDVDELRERMDQPENRMEMADAREQLEQTRENVRQASEALQEGQTSRALNEGTRAQRELEEMRDEFRRRTAGNFDDTMQQMRDDARALAEREREIGRQINEEDRPDQRRTLRDSDNREQIAEALERQQTDLQQLMDQMREVVEQSEESEPLLSSRLYDTYRETYREDPASNLQEAGEMLRRGFPEEGRRSEAQARESIERLQAGVEQAAESVLGDETEALRRAREQLERLTGDVENELAQADGRAERTRQPGEESGQTGERRRPGETDAQQSEQDGQRPGQQGTGEPRDGQQPGERDGEQQPGQRAGESRRPGQRGQPGQEEEQDQQRQPGRGQRGSQPSDDQQQPGEQQQPGGRQPGQQPGQNQDGQQQDGQQPGNQPGQQPGRQPGQQPGQRPGEQPGQQPGSGGRQPGQQPGQNQDGQQPGSQQQGGQQPGSQQQGGRQPGDPQGGNDLTRLFSPFREGGEENGGGTGGYNRPFTGDDWRAWSDNLRDVEEMLDDPELRAEAARVRERARDIRREVQSHSEAPNWELVRTSVYGPLLELEQRIAEEIARRTPGEELVPIDRDPVPQRYADLVREYYERLSAERRQDAPRSPGF